ncbi:MAG: hypothetical protein JO132_05550 [Streptosporangiaceae bacterium]|nr:hypothetical protein [Streptosporangiaceae bacterium]
MTGIVSAGALLAVIRGAGLVWPGLRGRLVVSLRWQGDAELAQQASELALFGSRPLAA